VKDKEATVLASLRGSTGEGRSLGKRLPALVLGLVFLALVTSTALASSGNEAESQGFPASKEDLQEATSGAIPIDMPDDVPGVGPIGETEDLGRVEAEELLRDVFGPAIEAPAAAFDELDVKTFHSDHVAVVAGPGPEAAPGLLSSSLPLRAENDEGTKELLDLALEPTEAHLEPNNPLVEVQIPAELSAGIALPESSLKIDLASASVDRLASTLGDASAFYPNVEVDTDFIVAAAPTGVETFTQLRSNEAPTQQTYEVAAPASHQFKKRADGGAQMVGPGGEVALSVTAPAAIDAEGNAVPATLHVDGHELTVSVDAPSDAVYPILVDPLFETFNAIDTNEFSSLAWKQVANPGFYTSDSLTGASVYSQIGPTASGNQGYWNYYVPRYWSDTSDPSISSPPTSYIRNMKLWNLAFRAYNKTNPYPFMQIGLWSDNKAQFVSHRARYGYEGDLNDPAFVYDLINPDEVTDVKRGGFSLATFSSYNDQIRELVVGQASVEVSDKDSPGFGELGTVSGWVNDQPGNAINYKATDPGLGIHQLRLSSPAAAGGTKQTVTAVGCTGASGSPCPRTASKALKQIAYDPQSMATGEHWVQVTAADPLNQTAVGTSRIKVDHMAPGLSLSGNLTEQGTVGTKLQQYTLNYGATDGDDAAAAWGLPIGKAGTGPGQLQRPMGVAVDSSGSIFVVDRLNNRVVKYDANGTYLTQWGSTGAGDGQFNDPRGIAISPTGTVWVTDLGNGRIQEFTAGGQFIRKALFNTGSQPYGIASGPGGVLWVTDIGLRRVVRLSESNLAYLGAVSGFGGHGGTSLVSPVGVATDALGNVWVADNGTDKILLFGSAGNWKFEFGASGSGDGQLSGPVGIDISPSGNIAVMDRNNSRVQIFETDGSYLRKFGTQGVGNAQFIEASGLSFGPGNSLFVADSGNQRVTRWSHADHDPQSGAAKVVVKVDGATVKTEAPGCSTKNCSIAGSWTLNADDYAVGPHKVEVTTTDGVGLETTKTLNVETYGDLQAPAIALSGPMTEQASLGTTRPTYRLRAKATDPGSTEERKSGVASTTIKVDGQTVDSASPGCIAGGCSLTREWTLDSDDYSVGSHAVEVKATDAAGRSTIKTLTINIERDTTAPIFEFLGPLYTAPSGWVEQKLYSYTANITDENGYGLTSVQLKIDGQVVKEQSGNCEEGGCGWLFGWFQNIDLSAYGGGAHPAELVATDGAGNRRKRTWTINVDPLGAISPSEAEETLEALDATSPVNTVGAPSSEVAYEGTASGLTLQPEGNSLVTQGSAAPTAISSNTAGELEVEVPVPTIDVACPNRAAEEENKERTGEEEEQLALTAGCEESSPVVTSETDLLTPVSVTPVSGVEGDSQVVTPNSAAAIAGNVAPNVDLVTRPLYDGAMTFTAIRAASAPESFSWQVHLDEGQTVTLKSPTLAEVAYPGGYVAFTISAVPAHDAVGTTVPTRLSVDGDVMTLHVEHRSSSFVYPVVAGAGWEGGFQTYEIVMPPPEGEVGEATEGEFGEGEGLYREATFGPPQSAAGDFVPLAARNNGRPTKKRRYNFHDCRFDVNGGIDEPPGGSGGGRPPSPKALAGAIKECHGESSEGPYGEYFTLRWATAMHGTYLYQPQSYVWINKRPQCKKWGPGQPALLNCLPTDVDAVYEPKLDILSFFRFPSGTYGVGSGGGPVCFQLNGVLPNRWVVQESGKKVLEVTMHTYKELRDPGERCTWQDMEKVS